MNWLFDNKEWIFSGAGVALLIGSVTFFSNYAAKKLAANKNKSSSQCPQIVDINEFDLLKKLIAEATEIKIFSSSAESYRTRLNIILKEIKIEKKKTIKILIRDNKSDYRNGELNGEMKKWKQDIEIATNNMISVEFKRYVHTIASVMLRGYIFDNNHAVLGWYLDTLDHRYGGKYPMTLYTNSDIHQAEIIEFSLQTFDYFFDI